MYLMNNPEKMFSTVEAYEKFKADKQPGSRQQAVMDALRFAPPIYEARAVGVAAVIGKPPLNPMLRVCKLIHNLRNYCLHSRDR